LLFAGTAYFIRHNALKETNYQNKVNKFIEKLHEKESLLNKVLDETINDIKTKSPNYLNKNSQYFESIFKKDEVAVVVSKNDSVIYWSTNTVPVEEIIIDTLYISEIFHLSNGWYEVREKRCGNYLARGAILIKREYEYQNDYLKTEFQKDFSLPDDCTIQLVEGEYNIFSTEGYLLCSLVFNKTKTFQKGLEHLAFGCFILSYIFFLSFLILLLKKITPKFKFNIIGVFLTGIFILGLRCLMFKLKIPGLIYSMDAFGPKYYAYSELFPSLGDLLLNVISVFLICVFFFNNFRRNNNFKINIHQTLRVLISIVLLFTTIFLSAVAFNIIKGLIINSSLIFDFNNIFSMDFYSIVGLIIVTFILLSFFLLSFILAEITFVLNRNKLLLYLITCLISGICFSLVNLNVGLIGWLYFIFIIIHIASLGFYLKRDNRRFTLQAIAFNVVIFSLLSTYCFYEYNSIKEKEKRKLLVSQLALEQDPIAEYLFSNIEKKIIADSSVQTIINSNMEDKEKRITDILQKNYFNGYWSRYNFVVVVCQPGQSLFLAEENIETDCDSFFMKRIKENGVTTANPDLFFLNEGSGRNSYLAKVPFNIKRKNGLLHLNLYIELDSKFLAKEQGYPELLVDNDIDINKDLYNYSYAKYKNDQLVLQYGKFNYNLNSNNYKFSGHEFTFFDYNDWNHLYYKLDASTAFIISKKSETLLDKIAPFSYIFIFYCLSVLVFLFVLHFPLKKREINPNFKTRIQISMFSVLIVSFVIIGASTRYYIKSLNNKKNLDNIIEKAHSVSIEIDNKLGGISKITPGMKDNVEDILTKLSNVFFTDINLYAPDGMLIASSSPHVFDGGMISRKMDSRAFYELTENKNTLYIHEESVGTLNYKSAYIPFINDNNELVGYINLPYFAKQSELKKEISTFLITFININVILTALAIMIALLVSNYITRPMKLIKDKIGQIKLGKKNEKIEWERNDEIGGLINDYNRMIDELAESAELLARSERESAWREMAKQVAHEIKNPLTPMKLSVQHLKRSWEDNKQDWDIRLEKFTKTMVEQIDSLSKIASEFSDFAKMPKANNENIDLISIIENTVILYQDNKQVINFIRPDIEQCIVFADRTQIVRVFNNLIKNSIQAISATNNGKIDIHISKENNHFIIRVADNGVGIAEEQKEKIFSPNFTTKTGGTGLGLAMVKSIVEGYGGKIWFESKVNAGTAFIIELPEKES